MVVNRLQDLNAVIFVGARLDLECQLIMLKIISQLFPSPAQQQMGSYPQDASNYGPTRSNYTTETQAYGGQAAAYNYDSAYQNYADTQSSTA